MADDKASSELAMRTITAIVMVLVSGTALWLGAMAWMVFVLIIGIGVWFEWSALCLLIYPPGGRRAIWRYGGAIYCGIACAVLLALRDLPLGVFWVLLITGAVIGTDVGAYFLGRLIGGPKIAPEISPSKTWAGLFGGILGASCAFFLAGYTRYAETLGGGAESGWFTGFDWQVALLCGALIAVVAQAGDFFESWMKRKAGVKDSGKLLPGHGGLFDRVDGLLPVLVVFGNLVLVSQLAGAR
ncbi:MAG: phosphatidate cytidylyltransferase [Sphingomonadaceae bacterium]|nr:phosphatidate cytidylyltransferase [Sphingomonadaceae bacterium]